MANHTDLNAMIRRILQIICGNLNVELGEFWQPDSSGQLHCCPTWHLKTDRLASFASATQALQSSEFDPAAGITGKIWATGEAFWSGDLDRHIHPARQAAVRQAGFRSALGFPVSHGSEHLGVMVFFSQEKRPASQDLLRVLTILANQISQYLLRQRAERELQRQNQSLQRELQRAADYVASLLPGSNCVSAKPDPQSCIQVHTQFQPSSQLGGDAFDYHWLDEDHLTVYLLDVAGHGVKAALLSVSVLNILRKRSLNHADFYQPETVVAALNRIFQMNDSGEDYFTLWYGVYHQPSRQLRFASAGHPPGVLIAPGAPGAEIRYLSSSGIAVGLLPDFPFDAGQCLIPPNSSLYLFSDGAYEVMGADQQMLGLDGWAGLLKQHWQSDSSLSSLLDHLHQITGQPILDDDFSVMEVRLP